MSLQRIKTNDTVIVISGDEAGKTGTVKKVDLRKGRAIVEGLNLVKKCIRRFVFAHNGKLFLIVSGYKCQDIGIGTKARTINLYIICSDHIEIFLGKLCLAVFDHVLRFH